MTIMKIRVSIVLENKTIHPITILRFSKQK